MLAQVTKKVKNFIQNIEIVSPKDYNRFFNNIAFDMGIEISEFNCDMSDTIDKHRDTLEENTSLAINAINAHDIKALELVNDNMRKLKEEIIELKELVYKDELTQVYNRKYITDNILNGEHFKIDGLMVILDMNNLKKINDTIGHVAGDKAILYLSKELKKLTEHTIRYGGDEFLLFFEEENIEKCFLKLHNLREKISTKKFLFKGQEFNINFAFAVIAIDSSKKFKDTLEIVDSEMYKDKERVKKSTVNHI